MPGARRPTGQNAGNRQLPDPYGGFVAASVDAVLDEVFVDLLLSQGYLRCGPSRAYVEFVTAFESYADTLRDPSVQLEFLDVCRSFADVAGTSKIDFHDHTDDRGYKLSFQLEYELAIEVAWNPHDVRAEFAELAVAAVRLVCHDLARSPIRFFADDPFPGRSTVRGITYYPNGSPGVDWHVDDCLAQFIAIPPGDAALYVARALPPPRGLGGIATSPGAVAVGGGIAPETVLLLGDQAGILRSGARGTPHAVAPVSRRRTSVTHFLWAPQTA